MLDPQPNHDALSGADRGAKHGPPLEKEALPAAERLRISAMLADTLAEIHSFVTAHYGTSLAVEVKPDASVVTAVDKEVERRLRDALARISPAAGFLGEETASPDLGEARRLFESDLLWVVDPIDGTSNFANGLPLFACSVGLWEKSGAGHHPTIGAVLVPATKELFYTDGSTVFSRSVESGRESIVAPADNEVGPGSVAILPTSFHRNFELSDSGPLRSFRQLGSTVLDILYTALGKSAGTLTDAHAWDFGGAAAIAAPLGVRFHALGDASVKDSFQMEDFTVGADPKSNWRLKGHYVVARTENVEALRGMIVPKAIH